MFKLRSPFSPTGDQPQAIEKLTSGILANKKNQVLLGVTGSGKTYVVANVIKNVQKPTLVLSHNKTLAAQLYQEFRDFFPENAVEYFVSYYDYYQPESYIPTTDTYIEKDADINDKIDRLRLSTTTSLMTRRDVIVVSSVSCIYNLGSPVTYSDMAIELRRGMKLRPVDLLTRLSQVNYSRSDFDFKRGTYRVIGDVIDVYLAYADYAVKLEVLGDTLVDFNFFEPITGNIIPQENKFNQDVVLIYPAKHYIAAQETREKALSQINMDLDIRIKELEKSGKNLEAYRIKQRTEYDLELIRELGFCKGIENYSRYFDGRSPGQTPYTLLDFFPKDFLLVVDESHITMPQVRGMYNGDRSRKQTLIDYGFRLPSALDNRPLNFEEFLSKVSDCIFVSATPNEWEIGKSQNNVVELLVRPTGIVDPKVTVLPSQGQIDDLLKRVEERVERKERVLITALTKRMAEELSSYLEEKGVRVTYLHSDIDTLERTGILDDLRKGNYDVLVGINLLREGLDLPEVSLVAILDADKEGFLRSEQALIQTMGRAARHVLGEVVMYADNITESMKRAISEVDRRRNIQLEYNKKHNVTPIQITKPIREKLIDEEIEESIKSRHKEEIDYYQLPPNELEKEIKKLEKLMKYEAEMLNFEQAAYLRDKIKDLKKIL